MYIQFFVVYLTTTTSKSKLKSTETCMLCNFLFSYRTLLKTLGIYKIFKLDLILYDINNDVHLITQHTIDDNGNKLFLYA